jgi:hypothetical protein
MRFIIGFPAVAESRNILGIPQRFPASLDQASRGLSQSRERSEHRVRQGGGREGRGLTLPTRNQSAPLGLKCVVRRCLERAPEQRFSRPEASPSRPRAGRRSPRRARPPA